MVKGNRRGILPEFGNPVEGYEITADDNGKHIHTFLVREGCDGSPNCAMEWYVSDTADWLGPGFNIHFSDSELEQIYQAVKSIRQHRRTTK
jgi:hypothetical protein